MGESGVDAVLLASKRLSTRLDEARLNPAVRIAPQDAQGLRSAGQWLRDQDGGTVLRPARPRFIDDGGAGDRPRVAPAGRPELRPAEHGGGLVARRARRTRRFCGSIQYE